jgi:hypothetical protein
MGQWTVHDIHCPSPVKAGRWVPELSYLHWFGPTKREGWRTPVLGTYSLSKKLTCEAIHEGGRRTDIEESLPSDHELVLVEDE